MCHANLKRMVIGMTLYDAHACKPLLEVLWIAFLNLVQEEVVNDVYDL